jgi:predicted RNA-binding Zn ribbon-like protein
MKNFDGLPLIAGHPALDFVNSVEYRGAPQPGDRLDSFHALARWGVAAGLISQSEFDRVASPGSVRSSHAARALRSAIALREALYAVVVAHVHRKPPPRGAGHIIDGRLRDASAASTLQHAEDGSRFWWHIPVRKAEDVAHRLAQSVDDLLLSLSTVAVHQCGGPRCDWLFIDRSHGHRRLWCQPSKCGNVVRVRRSRSR